ncbi:hypothetical protein HLK59_32900 [Streptomyces sp. S3(2020)]|uniref:hypothetical protein n=1 Tax=Streptomyces sp. S3(2020) TaxID=2732044 RepID=UPI00148875CA|nr:hypothetical protein [Streptomyces sp. S3(2020)]NNN35082.1 hypothetical protein [Streptomyces sp. S3(2020)]
MSVPHPRMRSRVHALLALGASAAAPTLLAPTSAHAATSATSATSVTKTVAAGETWEVTETTRLGLLVVEEGALLTAPEGYILTLTVNGVETGSALESTYGVTTVIVPGTYRGNVVVTPTVEHLETFAGYTFHLRQGVYVGSAGVVTENSVLSAVRGGRLTDAYARGVSLTSTAQVFNGFYVADGASYTLEDLRVAFDGNGRCDFASYGAAVTGAGEGTRLVVDGACIDTQGVVRSALIARDGADVVVKNSRIRALNGVLPDDYVPAGGANMLTVPWRLGLTGNIRATNVIGTNTKATYINSAVSSEQWGVLSTDSVSNSRLTTINSTVTITGDSGYGTYADGKSQQDLFLGTDFDVATWVAISTGSPVVFGDSTQEAVSALNTELELGLTDAELAAIEPRSCVLTSRGFGVMWHSGDGGSVTIGGGTRFSTAETMFLDKAVQMAITVDGSQGAQLQAGNGVLVQIMETDNPGSLNGVYTEPTGDATRDTAFDTTAEHTADATASFTDIALQGDFYNAMRTGKNLVVSLDGSRLDGVISASASRHAVTTISSAEWEQLSHVTNTPQPAINNGVIVKLGAGSVWTVTGTSYLTRLAVDAAAEVRAVDGGTLTLTVDGTVTALTPGTAYAGALVLAVG